MPSQSIAVSPDNVWLVYGEFLLHVVFMCAYECDESDCFTVLCMMLLEVCTHCNMAHRTILVACVHESCPWNVIRALIDAMSCPSSSVPGSHMNVEHSSSVHTCYCATPCS